MTVHLLPLSTRVSLLLTLLLGVALGGLPGPASAQPSAGLRAALVHAPLATAPDTLRPPLHDPWLARDKAQHLAFSLLWTLATQYVLVSKGGLGERAALPLSAGTAATVGLAKELYDRYHGPTRYFSRRDLVADGVGIGLGTLVILWEPGRFP